MGVILTGIVAAIAVALIAGLVLPSFLEKPSWEVFSTTSARVGDPGENLVGPNWSGEGRPQPAESS